ncbi:MAG: hypothetical protein ABF812_16470, partial [Gluconobacter cerinus]|uniref:hypothetical protein n=1 Tax=Gluconobacter cerinus TaxID=38307 RepID=UPI0039E98E1C
MIRAVTLSTTEFKDIGTLAARLTHALPDGKNALSAERHSLVKGLLSYGTEPGTATPHNAF